jgi:hypothetical protein
VLHEINRTQKSKNRVFSFIWERNLKSLKRAVGVNINQGTRRGEGEGTGCDRSTL